MPSMIRPAQAARIQKRFRNLEDTMKAVFWDVSWVAWRKHRPIGTWDAGTAGESPVQVATGTGRLRENGPAGLQLGDDVIFADSGWVLRTDVSAFDAFRTPDAGKSEHDVSAAYLVIDGTRLFKVEGFKPRGGARQHANAYLKELFGQALPVEVTP